MSELNNCYICHEPIGDKPSRAPTPSCQNHDIHIDCMNELIAAGYSTCSLCGAEIPSAAILIVANQLEGQDMPELIDDMPITSPRLVRQNGFIFRFHP